MNKYNIEKVPDTAQRNDLITLWEKSVRATHNFLVAEDLLIYRQLLLDNYLKQVDLYCIHIEDEIAGFIGVDRENVEMLFVSPTHFSKGIGKALMTFAVDSLDCNAVDVNEQNLGAVAFYLKLGFKPAGRTETDALGKPYPLIHMRLN
ncbi:GNAT family N-acetyltransferase [Flavobacterium olei]|uniref:GNAT family N-acetyltransferase n=1 Tax=Flavobacterium olei TaxID=1886782 RepID=UPI00321ADD19